MTYFNRIFDHTIHTVYGMYFVFKIKCADESCTMRPGMHMKKMHVPGLIHFVFMLTLNGGEKKNLKQKGKK